MKPSEFFVGVIDFFAILMPGAIATAFLAPHLSSLIFGSLLASPTTEAGGWAIFLTSAYFLGHLIFLMGSYIDPIYNVLRQHLNPYNNESAFQGASRIRDSLVEADEAKALNTFQWSRSVLIAICPTAAEDVHRLEADSKFFRSLLVVCVLSAVVFAASGKAVEGLCALALVLPCFFRYYERRLKGTTQAYIHVITLHRLGKLKTPTTQNGTSFTRVVEPIIPPDAAR